MAFFKKNGRILCICAGVLLILTACCLLTFRFVKQKRLQYDAAKALSTVETLLPTIVDTLPEERSKDYMPAMEIDGLNIAGIVEVPQYGVKLPLRATWHKDAVASLPCRYTGSVYNGTLVIGAVGSDDQLGCASKMDVGDLLYVTDMEGGRYRYAVEKIEHAKRISAERLDKGDYDLTVFVRMGRGEYLLVRLNIN